MPMTLGPLDQLSLVVDEERRFMREWYQWLVDLTIQTGVARAPVTVAKLPTPSSIGVGAKAYVSDATVATFGSPVVGGGTLMVPVYCDGSGATAVWRIG